MNLKNNKGITLVALVITIIVMLIITGITMYGGSKIVKEARTEDVKTNLLLLQAEIKNYVEQAKFENKTIEDFLSNGVTVGNSTLKIEEAQEIEGEQFYSILTPMSEFKLDKLNSDNILIAIDIDNVFVEIYFIPGVSNGETTNYLLSEM